MIPNINKSFQQIERKYNIKKLKILDKIHVHLNPRTCPLNIVKSKFIPVTL